MTNQRPEFQISNLETKVKKRQMQDSGCPCLACQLHKSLPEETTIQDISAAVIGLLEGYELSSEDIQFHGMTGLQLAIKRQRSRESVQAMDDAFEKMMAMEQAKGETKQ